MHPTRLAEISSYPHQVYGDWPMTRVVPSQTRTLPLPSWKTLQHEPQPLELVLGRWSVAEGEGPAAARLAAGSRPLFNIAKAATARTLVPPG